MSSSEKPAAGCLRAEFIEQIRTGAVKLPKRSVMAENDIDAHTLSAMRKGEILPWECFERLIICCRRVAGKSLGAAKLAALKLEDIAEPRDEPPVDPFMPDLLLHGGWSDVRRLFTSASHIPPLSFCNSDRTADFEDMADLILDSLGWLDFRSHTGGTELSPEAARLKGEELSGLKYDRWVTWLQGMCKADFRSVMFAVASVPNKGKRVERRLGSTILLSLKEDRWARLRAGEMGYSQLTGDDIQSPSRHLLLHSMSEVRSSDHPKSKLLSSKTISFAQVRTMLYQMATSCPMIRSPLPSAGPSILCLAPLHLHQRRAPAYGFISSGTREPDTKSVIWELTPSLGTGYLLAFMALFGLQCLHHDEVLRLSD